ncbi:MAG: alpha/beta hydrolase [Segniliparus sp.]|uniref:alpha/beta hydrolase n=1 Tax=Segniliparus sp. TaxID=2804064 RepID=UPI003F31B8A7
MGDPSGSSIPDTNIRVSGGAGGTSAVFEDFGEMGRLTDDVGADALTTAGKGHKYLADPNVIASAVLDPVGAAKFEGAMLGALDGPKGLTAVAGVIELRSIALRAAEAGYQFADEANRQLLADLEWTLAAAAPGALPAELIGILGVATGSALADYIKNGGDISKLKDDEIKALQRLIVEHPGLVDAAVNMAPGMLSNLQGFPIDLQQGAAEIGLLYPDGTPKLTPVDKEGHPIPGGVVASTPSTSPKNLGDIVGGLAAVNANSTTGANIEVRKVTGPDGKPRYIVDVPGTKEWNVTQDPSLKPNVNDLGTNIRGLSGQETTLQKDIEKAMLAAGVKPGDPVMMVGHSQGGIVAANAAADWVKEGKYNVTNVVTAGSPVGLVDMPGSVKVLSLENSGDIVPHLDGRSNPDTSNWTTVTFDHQTGTVGGNHDMDYNGYAQVAKNISNSSDPSISAFNQSLTDNGFTTGTSTDDYEFRGERTP